ncbi:MAG TPA: energy transducer TonB [Longimicrobium sp.]|jgi:TonB family protein|uniref:energy transducer TonB n=1 Tax=Longimicrobium sp. TaxID=2029185 RepID=UPI002ED95623
MRFRHLLPALVLALLSALPAAAQSDDEAAYELSAVTVRPRPLNVAELQTELERLYPPALRDAGVTGSVQVRFRVNTDGTVSSLEITSSTDRRFDAPTLAAVSLLRFSPAEVDGRPVPVWAELPIQWQIAGEPVGPPPPRSAPPPDTGGPRPDSATPSWPAVPAPPTGSGTPSPPGAPSTGVSGFVWMAAGIAATLLLVALAWVAGLFRGAGREPADAFGGTRVYEEAELDVQPHLLNPEALADARYDLPTVLRYARASGRVMTSFVVDAHGRTGEVRVVKASHPELHEPALRVLQGLRFKPGQVGGRSVAVRVSLPIEWDTPGR